MRNGRFTRRWLRMGCAVALGGLLPGLVAGPASAGLLDGLPLVGNLPLLKVIVMSDASSNAAGKVTGVGGTVVDSDLGLVNGVVAELTPVAILNLLTDSTVTVSPDSTVTVSGSPTPAPSTPAAPTRPPAAVFPITTGASRLAARGLNGAGQTVAVLDTGITPLPDFAGRLVGGVDLSGERNPFQDSYGHGTFVAGLIAGNGASSNGQYAGEAPGAGLVSIKAAGASGSTDMATVIKGVDWAVRNRSRLNIGVLNLSLGALPVSSTALNPLDRAVEFAWRSGIVVVTSAGNAGPFNGTILSPGDDPLVVTVGATDDMGTAKRADDTMTTFSSVGPTATDGWFKPDLVTSGRSVVSLRAPGSTIDTTYPTGRVGTANFVGSGTSFSTGVASGAAALILEANPGITADNVKARLLGTTTAGPVGNPFVDGHGALDAYAAATTDGLTLDQSAATTTTHPGQAVCLSQTWTHSTWNGALWTGLDGGPGAGASGGAAGTCAPASPASPASRLAVTVWRVVLERTVVERVVVERGVVERIGLERLVVVGFLVVRFVLVRLFVERLFVERLILVGLFVERLVVERLFVERLFVGLRPG